MEYSVLFIVLLCGGTFCLEDDENSCSRDATNCRTENMDSHHLISLYRPDYDPAFEDFQFEGKKYTVRKRSSRPLLYEIEDLLSDEEMNAILEKADEFGYDKGTTNHVDMDELWVGDFDADGRYNISEMRIMMESTYYAYVLDHHVRDMYDHFGLDEDGDGIVSHEELESRFPEGYAPLSRFIHDLMDREPTTHARISETSWLLPDQEVHHPVLGAMMRRVAALTHLPLIIIEKSDLQVARYGPGGYYNIHTDSDKLDPDTPCSTRYYRRQPNRQCRFATLLIYLSDVEEGGETSFPIAEMPDDYETYRLRLFSHSNLNEHCYDSNVLVKPKRGKAVLWYNHMVNRDGWLGESDPLSEHGGCPVKKGLKVIANFWLLVTEDKEADLTPWTGEEETLL